MTLKYPFHCKVCDAETLQTIEQTKGKIICDICKQYESDMLEIETKVRTEIKPNTKYSNLPEYAVSIGYEIVSNINSNRQRSVKQFEKILHIITSDDKLEYHKLKYEISTHCKSMIEIEVKNRVQGISNYSYTFTSRPKVRSLSSSKPSKYSLVLTLIENLTESIEYIQNANQLPSTPIGTPDIKTIIGTPKIIQNEKESRNNWLIDINGWSVEEYNARIRGLL